MATKTEQTENNNTTIDLPTVTISENNTSSCSTIISKQKGNLSNLITFLIFIFGILLYTLVDSNHISIKFILSAGIFGFSGGITNWLAVKMLFERVPLLYGSGVIPNRFKDIRQAIKKTLMESFFDREYLETYLQEKSSDFLQSINIATLISDKLKDPSIDSVILNKFMEISRKPEGAFLMMFANMVPGGMEGMLKMIKPLLINLSEEMSQQLMATFSLETKIDIDKIRIEIDNFLTTKVEQITPEMLKKIIEDVIREHLGWLIIWGNIFGALLGIISQAVGYGV